jgi:hypothetical protein
VTSQRLMLLQMHNGQQRSLNASVCMCASQVTIMEDEEQNIHFKNLSVHRAATEEEALNLVRLTTCQLACSGPTRGDAVPWATQH